MLTEERKSATRAVVHTLARLRGGRKCPPAFRPGTPVVVALDGDLMSIVSGRIAHYATPVVLAVYFPRSSRLELLTIEVGRTSAADLDQPIRTGVDTTVGMMLDASTRISLPQQWDAFNVTGRFTPTVA